jgi:5'-nucleotidase
MVPAALKRAAAGVSTALVAALLVCSPPLRAHQSDTGSPRSRARLTILQLNDVYSTVPIDDAGGLARVATLKQQLAAAGRTPLLVLAGDFLSPSVASSVFKGEQMIQALNAAGLDVATLGNHEFDFGDDVLIQRMHEARWTWVVSNVIDTRTNTPIGGARPYIVRSFGPLKVGFIGLVLTSSEISRYKLTHTRLVDPIRAAALYLPALRRAGANVIVAITHLAFADDRALAARYPQIDLVIGGHEHFPITATVNRTLISKAGSDARWIARIDVNRQLAGPLERFYELVPITKTLADDPDTARVVASYEAKLGAELDVEVGTTSEPLDARSASLRTAEANAGNLVADAVRADVNADVAIINGGGIRGDRIFPAGPILRRTLLNMQPFGNVVCKIEVPGRVVLQALESGVSKLPAAAGQFPQTSGLTLEVNGAAPPGRRVTNVRVNGTPLDADKRYTLALSDYVMKGGDNYSMFSGQRALITPETGDLVFAALEKYVAAAGTIAPKVEGRIVIR